MRWTSPLLAVSLICAAAAPVAAQERPDMPHVEAAPVPRNPDAGLNRIMADFRAWNAARGHPRMLIFWDRALTDETTTRYRDVTTGSGDASVRAAAVAGPGWKAAGANATTDFKIVQERERTTGKARGSLDADSSDVLESAYRDAFIDAGVTLLDRDALMRKVSVKESREDRSDQQFLESVALEQGVQYLVEVLPQSRSDSPTGMKFKIKITHLPTSRVTAQFLSDGLPPAGPSRLVARPGGFERVSENRNTPDRIARQIASETMAKFF